MMIAAVDVDYRADAAVAAAVTFAAWPAPVAVHEVTHASAGAPAAYEPGQFYRRELPHLLAVLARLPVAPDLVVVDGFVWLEAGRPGLGAHLHAALGGAVPVIGVAKRPYRHANDARAVLRGTSQAALWVTAIDHDVALAADAIRSMHGSHRIPDLLRRVDRLARDG